MTFRSTAIRHTGGAGFELDGDLTIEDVTKPVTLRRSSSSARGKDPYGNTISRPRRRTKVEREDWDLTWNMAVETGGFLVSKKIDLDDRCRGAQGR